MNPLINPMMFGLSPFWPQLQHNPFLHHKFNQRQWQLPTKNESQYLPKSPSISSDEDTVKTEVNSVAQSTASSDRSSSSKQKVKKWKVAKNRKLWNLCVWSVSRVMGGQDSGPMLRHVTTNYIPAHRTSVCVCATVNL